MSGTDEGDVPMPSGPREFLRQIGALHQWGPWKRLRRRVRTWRSAPLWRIPARPVARPIPSRLVVSLTTSPDRIVNLDRVVRTLLNQSCAPDEIHLNVPHVFRRSGRTYEIPAWCQAMGPRFRLFRVEDIGPATKSVPTILRFAPDEDVVIVIVDDDVLYLQRTLEAHCLAISADPGCAYGLAGYDLLPGGDRRQGRGNVDVGVLEGWASISLHRGIVGEGLERYFEAATRSRACFAHDDVVMSNWLALRGVRRRLVHDRRATIRMMRARGAQLDIGYLSDSLHRGTEPGSSEPLLRVPEVESHLRSLGLWALGDVHGPAAQSA
jgi:hypothetical protein